MKTASIVPKMLTVISRKTMIKRMMRRKMMKRELIKKIHSQQRTLQLGIKKKHLLNFIPKRLLKICWFCARI